MQLWFPAALLIALLAAELPGEAPPGGLAWRLLVVAAGALLPPLLAMTAAALTVRSVGDPGCAWRHPVQRFARWRGRAQVLWLLSVAGIALGARWGQIVRDDLGLREAVLADELLILLPVIGPLMLLWSATARVETALMGATTSGKARRKVGARWGLVVERARTEMLPVLLPVLAAVTLADLLRRLTGGRDDSELAVFVLGPFVLGLAAAFPWLLRMAWRTEPLAAGPLLTRLQAAARRAGQPIDGVLIWQTGDRIANAAVAGFVPGGRFVFLSDGLLARLSDEQVEAVFLHELGHLKRRHLIKRGLVMAVPLAALGWLNAADLLSASSGAGTFGDWTGAHWTAAHGAGAAVVASLGLAGYVLAVFGRYARALESEADLFACLNLPAQAFEATAMYCGALERLTALSGRQRTHGGWQHDSLVVRQARVEQLARDPHLRRRFARRLNVVTTLVLVADFAGLAAWFAG